MSRVPTQGIDYTSRDYEAYRELMIQKLQEKMPEYTDVSQTDAGIVILECLANGLDILSMYSDNSLKDESRPIIADWGILIFISPVTVILLVTKSVEFTSSHVTFSE